MTLQVCHGATLRCSQGLDPGRLLVPSTRRVTCGGVPVAEVRDHRALLNIVPFGTCVAGAWRRRCQPETLQPWSPGAAEVEIEAPGARALDRASTLACERGGIIRVADDAAPAVGLP